MTITKISAGSQLTLALNGRLDTNTAPELEKTVQSSLEGVEHLTIDMTDLEYLSSAGLRVLLSAQKQMSRKGSMTVCNVNSIIKEIFEVTGFDNILTIE